ncbi:flavodoxin family protein [Lacrimispora sp.]|uniref:flavodoxin family protein n=1 Tax=Lacrimispora sp. TaxID=2719234 RepID=UPI0032E46F6A
MGKKIMVLNGSPRKNGNTSGLVQAFTKGAEEIGSTVTTFFLEEMNINGCKGCLKGGKNHESPCVLKDDMEQIYSVYREADIVVLASPMYYWNWSGQLKIAFDRLCAIEECNPNFNNLRKDSVLLIAAAEHDFDEVTYYYHKLINHLQWSSLGQVFAGDVMHIGDINGHEKLVEAYELGKAI